jgi:hypothetical protein
MSLTIVRLFREEELYFGSLAPLSEPCSLMAVTTGVASSTNAHGGQASKHVSGRSAGSH